MKIKVGIYIIAQNKRVCPGIYKLISINENMILTFELVLLIY